MNKKATTTRRDKAHAIKAPKGKAKDKGKQKQVSSPIATGGRAITFENRVQACALLAMCMDLPYEGAPDGYSLSKITFQGRVHNHNTDDLVIDAISRTGGKAKIRMQMKRTLIPTKSNSAFKEAIGLAWIDFSNPEFQRGLDLSIIAYMISSAKSMASALEVSNMARSSTDFASWHLKVHAEGFSNKNNRETYAAILEIAGEYNDAPISNDEFKVFVEHLSFKAYDLDSDTTTHVALQKQLLATAGFDNNEVSIVWASLVHVSTELNGQAADIDLKNIGSFIGSPIETRFNIYRARKSDSAMAFATLDRNLDSRRLTAPIADSTATIPSAQKFTPNSLDTIPAARQDSLNKMISVQLDSAATYVKQYRYLDAQANLAQLGQDMSGFDGHQKARWYLLRGTCRWHLGDDNAAADDFIKSSTLYDGEDKIAAAGIRGWMLKGEVQRALDSSAKAEERFPSSLIVWATAANVRFGTNAALSERDIPHEFRDNALAWEIIAASNAQKNDLSAALQYARTALTKTDSSFFTRDSLLAYAVSISSGSNLFTSFRMMSNEMLDALNAGISAFNDREKDLWSPQGPKAQKAVVHLGYALLLSKRPDDALALTEEARRRITTDIPELYRIEIEALGDLDRPKEGVSEFLCKRDFV